MESTASMRFGGTMHGKTISRSIRTPLWLCLAIVSMTACFYLIQSGQMSAANTALQQQRQTQQQLEQAQQQAQAQLATVQSPHYVVSHALGLGMVLRYGEDGR